MPRRWQVLLVTSVAVFMTFLDVTIVNIAFPDVRVEVEGADQPIGLVSDNRLIGQALLNLVKNAAESVQARRVRDAPHVLE